MGVPISFQGKTILVAGAAGFIPSHLCEFYMEQGAQVIGLDNFVTGSKSNIEILQKQKAFEFFECDVTEKLPDFKGRAIDFIFNLASPASPVDFEQIPLEILRTNSLGTWNLLELARSKGARLLQASTSEVYGDPMVHPQKEDYFGNVNPNGLRACYDESKRFSEALVMTYHRQYDLETRLVRIFNTYGPRMRPCDGRVIPNFVNQALKGEDITVYGDGSQTRSFCYVSDLVVAMDIVMRCDDPTPVNIGNPDEYTILDAARFIVEALDSKSKIKQTGTLPSDDPKRRCPNIDKLKKLGDFSPQISFQEGLARTANYFKSLM